MTDKINDSIQRSNHTSQIILQFTEKVWARGTWIAEPWPNRSKVLGIINNFGIGWDLLDELIHFKIKNEKMIIVYCVFAGKDLDHINGRKKKNTKLQFSQNFMWSSEDVHNEDNAWAETKSQHYFSKVLNHFRHLLEDWLRILFWIEDSNLANSPVSVYSNFCQQNLHYLPFRSEGYLSIKE